MSAEGRCTSKHIPVIGEAEPVRVTYNTPLCASFVEYEKGNIRLDIDQSRFTIPPKSVSIVGFPLRNTTKSKMVSNIDESKPFPVPLGVLSVWQRSTRDDPLVNMGKDEPLPEEADVVVIGSGLCGKSELPDRQIADTAIDQANVLKVPSQRCLY